MSAPPVWAVGLCVAFLSPSFLGEAEARHEASLSTEESSSPPGTVLLTGPTPLPVPAAAAPPSQLVRPGALFHLTGCEGGRLLNPRIDLLDAPPGPGPAYFVARLRGTSEETFCRGDVVLIREVRLVHGERVVRVEPILDDPPQEEVSGWVRARFIGAPFPRRRCQSYFSTPEAEKRCLEAGL